MLVGEMNECIINFAVGWCKADNSILEWIVGVLDDLIRNALYIANKSRLLFNIWFVFLCL